MNNSLTFNTLRNKIIKKYKIIVPVNAKELRHERSKVPWPLLAKNLISLVPVEFPELLVVTILHSEDKKSIFLEVSLSIIFFSNRNF